MTTTDQNIAEDQEGNLKRFEGVDTPFRRFLSDFCESRLAVMGFIVIASGKFKCGGEGGKSDHACKIISFLFPIKAIKRMTPWQKDPKQLEA